MNKKMLVIMTVVILLTAMVAGAYVLMKSETNVDGDGALDETNGNGDDAPRQAFTITDIRGREVAIPGEIHGIIALGACSLRMLSYFDSIDKVVAVDMQEKVDSTMFSGQYFESSTYRVAFPDLRDLPNIGSPSSINVEAIIAEDPDIVFSSTTDVLQLDNMQTALNIPVVAVNADLEMDSIHFYRQITIVGRILGEEDRAQELVDGLEHILEDLARRAAGITTARTAYSAGMFFYGGGGLYKTSGDYLPFAFTGVKNVMPSSVAGVGKQPYNTDIETLIDKNPEFIFIDSITENVCRGDYNDDKILLDDVSAFANQNVYTTLVYKNYGTNWENQVINMYYVGSVVYPEQYEDVNIQDKAEDIWRLFFQVDLSYDEVVGLQNGPGLGNVEWWP